MAAARMVERHAGCCIGPAQSVEIGPRRCIQNGRPDHTLGLVEAAISGAPATRRYTGRIGRGPAPYTGLLHDAADPVREDLARPRGRAGNRRYAGGAVRRPAPDARGHLAQAFAQLRARGLPRAPAGAHARDARPRDADRHRARSSAACRSGSRAAARQIAELERNARDFGVELLGLARRAPRHRARDRPGARPHAAGHDDRLRRQPHQHARRLRHARLRHRHDRGRRTCSRRSACCSESRRRSRSRSRARSRRASAPRTSCSRSSASSASRAAPAR